MHFALKNFIAVFILLKHMKYSLYEEYLGHCLAQWLIFKNTIKILLLLSVCSKSNFLLHAQTHSQNTFHLFDVKCYFSTLISYRNWWQRSLLTSEDWYFLKRLFWFLNCVHMMESEYCVNGNIIWEIIWILSNHVNSVRVKRKDKVFLQF